jgi:hypothetical protein
MWRLHFLGDVRRLADATVATQGDDTNGSAT